MESIEHLDIITNRKNENNIENANNLESNENPNERTSKEFMLDNFINGIIDQNRINFYFNRELVPYYGRNLSLCKSRFNNFALEKIMFNNIEKPENDHEKKSNM